MPDSRESDPELSEMNASLVDVFWNDGPSGTSENIKKSWDIYDLWANRMPNETANAIIDASYNLQSPSNVAAKVYSQVPSSSSKELMGSKVGSVNANGILKANVQAHGVVMLRLRSQNTYNEL